MDKSVDVSLREINPLVLAYMGDAYIEVLSRRYIIGDGNCKVQALNKTILSFVTAKSQCEAAKRIEPLLTEEEYSVFRAGRNAKPKNIPRSATPAQYRQATALECLFGYLYFKNAHARAEELFYACYNLQEV